VRERTGAGADAVFDPVGGERFTDTIRCLRPGGRALVVGFAGGGIPEVRTNRLLLRNVEVAGVSLSAWMAHEPDVLPRLAERLSGLLREAAITPVVGRRLPLDAAAEALRALEERRAAGKIVLDVA
jgi:NADPH2:quinone reductase